MPTDPITELFRNSHFKSSSLKVGRGVSLVCPASFSLPLSLSLYLALNNEMPPQSALK